MNEKLLKTRLASIAHYKSESDKLSEALKITNETRNELIKSMIEFFPFNVGDIVSTNNGNFFKILKIKHAIEAYKHDIGVVVRIAYSGRYGAWNDEEDMTYIFEQADWKLLIPAPVKTES